MDFRNTMISDLFPCSSVYYDFDALQKLEATNAIESPEGCFSWLDDKPPLVASIDSSIRKTFSVPIESKMVFRLIKPPEFTKKEPVIPKPSRKVTQRVIISTIAESPVLDIGGGRTQIFKMKGGDAYSIPYPVNKMVSIQFDNKRTMVIPARKGFRQQKRTKRVEKRYIMLFDYIEVDDITDAVKELKS